MDSKKVPLKYIGRSDVRAVGKESGLSQDYIWPGPDSVVDVADKDAKIILEKTNDFERLKRAKMRD